MWLHPDIFWIGVLHANEREKEKGFNSENGHVKMQTHSDNTSILAPSSDGLVPLCHRTSVSVRESQVTSDTFCTICGCSLAADK